jgi:hypothetical protein
MVAQKIIRSGADGCTSAPLFIVTILLSLVTIDNYLTIYFIRPCGTACAFDMAKLITHNDVQLNEMKKATAPLHRMVRGVLLYKINERGGVL